MRIVYAVALALLATGSVSAKTLTIGLDESSSNPTVRDPRFAKIGAEYVHAQIVALAPGDFVHVRTFAERGSAHAVSKKIRIDKNNRVQQVAASVAQHIAGLPGKALEGQNQTNIIAFLEFGSAGFDCSNRGRVLLLTDAVEASSYISANSLLAGKPLPAPEADLLKGCDVVMFGLGQSADGSIPPQAIKTLRASWSAWMKTAGANFTAIIDP